MSEPGARARSPRAPAGVAAAPLVAGVALTAGAGLALLLGGFLLSWALAVGAAAALVFGCGAVWLAGDDALVARSVLAAVVALLGFVGVSAAMTLTHLESLPAQIEAATLEPLGVETVEEARARLMPRWVTLGAAALGTLGVWIVAIRRHRRA